MGAPEKFEPEERTDEFPEPIESQINRKTDEKVHGGRYVLVSPISTTFTLASCLKNAASVCSSTLENKLEIVVLLSFVRFDVHERSHFGYIYMNTLLIQPSI